MTIILKEDFEGDLSKWDFTGVESGATITQQSQVVLAGAKSLRIVTAGATQVEGARCRRNIDLPEFYVDLNFKIVSRNESTGKTYLAWAWGSQRYTSALIYVGIERDYEGLYRWVLVLGTALGPDFQSFYSLPFMPDDQKHDIRLHWKSDAVDGYAELFVDGVKVVETSHINTSFAGNARFLHVGAEVVGNAPDYGFIQTDVVIDDVLIADEPVTGLTHTVTFVSDLAGISYLQPLGTTPFSVEVPDGQILTVQVPSTIGGYTLKQFMADGQFLVGNPVQIGPIHSDLVINAIYLAMPPQKMKLGIYGASWNFGELTAEQIVATFDMSQSWVVSAPHDYSAKMNQVHALNPNYKALVYRNVGDVYYSWTDEFNLANGSGWLLKDTSGNYLTSYAGENYQVDITRPDYQLWLAQKIKSWLDAYPYFDGVMADNALKYSAAEWLGNKQVINPRTGALFTDQEALDGCAGLLNAIIDAVGSSKIVLPNGIWSGFCFGDNYRYVLSNVPRLNGLMSEGTFLPDAWFDETRWKQSVDMVAWMQDNFLSGHPERYFVGGSRFAPEEQAMKYCFCSMMLAVKYSSQNIIYFGEINDHPNLVTLAQKLHSVDVGDPLGNYYKTGSVYARDFENGKVLVNPTDSAYTVTLDKSYTTIDGTTVSGPLTVDAHTGVLLFGEPTPIPPIDLATAAGIALGITDAALVGYAVAHAVGLI